MRILCLMVVCAVAATVSGGIGDTDIIFLRGDSNSDGAVNVSDSSHLSNYLFNGGGAPPCENQADVNADGSIDLSDVTFLNNWLFLGGPPPPAPGPFATSCSTTNPYIACSTNPCP